MDRVSRIIEMSKGICAPDKLISLIRMEVNARLGFLSKEFDVVDRVLVDGMEKRMQLSGEVDRLKRVLNDPIRRKEVEERRRAAVRELAKEKGLDPDFCDRVWALIIEESCRIQEVRRQTAPKLEELSKERLTANLLRLGEAVAPDYESYMFSHFATRSCILLEEQTLTQEIGALRVVNSLGMAVDAGCATGRIARRLSKDFEKVYGIDISPAMIREAETLKKDVMPNVEFVVADIEKSGIPAENDSVSLVVMNLGTASDILDIQKLLAKIKRVLKPNGRFLLSFYNSGALLYFDWVIPWPVALASKINREKRCLDVFVRGEAFSVPGRPYTIREVRNLVQTSGLTLSRVVTYPTIGSILPDELLKKNGNSKFEGIQKIDKKLTDLDMGAYILATGWKKA